MLFCSALKRSKYRETQRGEFAIIRQVQYEVKIKDKEKK